MNDQARLIWDTLEFRTPAMLQAVERLSENQMLWQPPNGANSVAWLLWHIAEVEDNWVRDRVYLEPRHYPFGASVRDTAIDDYPGKARLLEYFHEVRALSRQRLEQTDIRDFDRVVEDPTFGSLDVRRVWIGAATSCAWHGGQIVLLTNRILPR
jgi:hypothetical protein